MWTFQIKWPPPFSGEWLQSLRKFDTPQEACNALSGILTNWAEEDVFIMGRLKKLNAEETK